MTLGDVLDKWLTGMTLGGVLLFVGWAVMEAVHTWRFNREHKREQAEMARREREHAIRSTQSDTNQAD